MDKITMNRFDSSHSVKRSFTLIFSALFALALAIAQPHRVHHSFENTNHDHHHGETDSHQHGHSNAPGKNSQTECVVQAVSQHCAAVPVSIAAIPTVTATTRAYFVVLRSRIYHVSSSPFLQRAPPAVSFAI
jgi:hypothetical protein